MALKDDLEKEVDSILSQEWDIREGKVVPETADVALAGGGVKLDATMLYADLADSTDLAMNYDRRIAAKVFKCFLANATRIVRAHSGDIRSFDGDRVMAVFIGEYKNTNAAKCALKINYAVTKIIKPKLEAKYEKLRTGSWKLQHCTGVDASEVLVVRGGIRNNNDLIWVGRAPNVAAKLSTIREAPYFSFLTKAVYDKLNAEAKKSSDGRDMWEERTWSAVSGISTVYRSSWTWVP
jgi:adenylate cyclase